MYFFIKNMVCNRCILVVKQEFEKEGIEPVEVNMGEVKINPQTRINLLRVSIPNAGQQMRPGMSAYIKISSNSKTAIALPIDAVVRTKNMSMVWVKTSNNKFRYQMVSTGVENGDKIEITTGLKVGDAEVVAGTYLLNSEYMLRSGSNSMGGMKM